MYLYLLMGFAIALGLSLVFGFFVHYALSIILICLYFAGLIYIVRKYHRENDSLQRAIHFNTCLAVRNENERLYSRYNLRARVGFLSQWLEFHQHSSANHFSLAMHSHGAEEP
jgi:hypothetical protein